MSTVLDAGRGSGAGSRRGRPPLAATLRSPATAWAALGALVIATGALLFHETRGTSLWYDEWTWLLDRRGGSLSSFLDTHHGHLSLIPVAIYKLLFATVGIRHSAPYRALVIVGHLACCVLLFVYARHRVGAFLALVSAALITLFGPGWENLLWPFQITWLLSLGAGLGALLALDRRDRAGDLTACVLLAVSLASSGIGVPIAVGAALELAMARRRLGEAWIVAVPLGLYALWSLGYQHTSFSGHALLVAPSFVYTAASATLGALTGLSGSTGLDGQGALMTWGPALLVAAVAAVAWRLARIGSLPPRVASLGTMALGFWLLTAVNRAFISSPFASRYLYVGAFFVVLIAVELARGTVLSRRSAVVVGVLAGAAIVSNIGALRDASRLYRIEGAVTTADLGALELGRPAIPVGYVAQALPGYPFEIVPAAAYFAAERTVGTPAATPTQIAADPEPARTAADAELIHLHRLALAPAGSALPLGAAPAVDSVTAGVTTPGSRCVAFEAGRFTPVGTVPAVAVTAPPGGLVLEASGGPATVAVRRFASSFQTLGTIAPGGPAALPIAGDRSALPWHVQVTPTGRALVCGLP